MYVFGSGTLVFTPFGPNAAGNPTPTEFGTLQEVTIDISSSEKELYGKNQFPVAIARAAGKIAMKAKFATIYAKAMNDMFYGDSVQPGQKIGVIDERQPVTTNTATVTHSTAFVEDLGVRDYTTGLHYVKVPSAPTAGQYSVAAGVYTFAATDTGDKYISYTYLPAPAQGYTVTITNRPMGSMPTFSVVLTNNQYGPHFMIKFFNCISSKLTQNMKNEDFLIPEVDFAAFADSSNRLFEYDMDE
jgi:hypothetical protein